MQDEYLSRHPQEAKGGNPWLNAWKMIEDPDQNLDGDFMPAWIRAKRAIVKNWDEIEELNGNRQRTIDRIREFTELVSLLCPTVQELIPMCLPWSCHRCKPFSCSPVKCAAAFCNNYCIKKLIRLS